MNIVRWEIVDELDCERLLLSGKDEEYPCPFYVYRADGCRGDFFLDIDFSMKIYPNIEFNLLRSRAV